MALHARVASREVHPARSQEQHLGIHLRDGLPGRRRARLAVAPEHLPAPGAPDLLGQPEARRRERVEPVEGDDPRGVVALVAALGGDLLDVGEALAEDLDEPDGLVLGVGHRADGGDRVEDPLQARGIQDHDRGAGPRLPVARSRAGEDQVRPQRRRARPASTAPDDGRVTTGRPATAGGKSQACETPTRSSSSPRAQTISVAAGRSETMRIGRGGSRDGDEATGRPWPGAGRRMANAAAPGRRGGAAAVRRA